MSPDRGISRFRIKNSAPPPPCGEVGEPGCNPGPSGGGTVEARAIALRKNLTEVERLLWIILRQLKAVGLHFRRQAPFGRYILDFVCHSAKLVVEVDGSQHALPEAIEHDKKRTAFLESRGYFVLRFWNNDVISNRDGVSDTIFAIAKTPHHLRDALLKSSAPPLPSCEEYVRRSVPPPPCGEVDAQRSERVGWGPSTRDVEAPHPKIASRFSTSPQGGGGS
jgi:very-short-patch-repair endonuclease